MDETDRILYDLGYFGNDPYKKEQIKGFIQEAEQFMVEAGVKKEKITSALAKTIKSLWCEARDKKQPIYLVNKDKMIVSLISQLRR